MRCDTRLSWGMCLLLGGCAGPLDNGAWDDPGYRSLQERYRQHDAQVADDHTDSYEQPDPAHEFGAALTALSVDDAIRMAIANHPALRRAGYRVDAATGRVTQVGLYPNPAFVFAAEGLGSDAGRGGETIYKIEQEIVLGGRLDRAREVADADRLSAQAEFLAQEFAVAAKVSRAYFAVVAADERAARRRELADLAGQLSGAVSAQVDAGAATETDRLRAEVISEQAMLEVETARLDAHAARRALATSIGVERLPDLPLTTPADDWPELPPRDELAQAVLETNSRVSLARISLERARRAHELARAQAVPDMVASLGPRYSDPENETTLDLGVGIEIPLFDRNQGEIRATIADRLSAAAGLRVVQLELIEEVARAWATYEASLLAAGRYRDRVLPKAERTLELTRQAYLSGKAEYLRLVDAQQVVVESRIAFIDAQQRLHDAATLLIQLAQLDTPWRRAGSTVEEVNP